MAGLVDGLGGEELGQAGSQPSQLWLTGSVTSESQISGLNVFASASGTFARINNADGLIPSNSTGSPATYGAMIQAGEVTTAAGSGGTIEFGRQFADTSYYVTLTAGSATAEPAYVSGTKNVSGCEIVGDASITYNYIAVGK